MTALTVSAISRLATELRMGRGKFGV